MKKVILTIDTTQINRVRVGLRDNHRQVVKESLSPAGRAQMVLPLIGELLEQEGLKWDNLTAIEVTTGPGSFTGLRVGFAVGNALGFLLNIPVNNQPPGTVKPEYAKPD